MEEETLKVGQLPKPVVGEKQHVLHNDWTIWWDKKTKVSKELPYENAIVELCR